MHLWSPCVRGQALLTSASGPGGGPGGYLWEPVLEPMGPTLIRLPLRGPGGAEAALRRRTLQGPWARTPTYPHAQ